MLENGGRLESVPYCYEDQKMCNKAVDNYTHALKLVANCYKTQEMCDKPVNTYPSTIQFCF